PAWRRLSENRGPLDDGAPLIPDDDDLFAPAAPDPFAPGRAATADHVPGLESPYSPPPVTQAAPVPEPAPASPAAARAGGGGMIPDDWDDDLLGPAATPAPAPAADDPFAEPAPAPRAAPAPRPPQATPEAPAAPAAPAPTPTPAPVSAAPTPRAPPAPASAPGAGADAAARAFLSGAGIDIADLDRGEAIELMARMGAVYRIMVRGLREILMTRASIKGEFRMNQTMIGAGGNNALKFSITPEQAVEAMIRPPSRGYLAPEEAAAEAMGDIRAHEVAMVTGMEAALKHLLAELDPEKLSARIEGGSALGGLLGGRKAKLWEAYESEYARIAQDVEEDFQAAFGREFARAYEEQLKKL
ncbi:MAG: type VI secretion system-associated FHA domain protein TagH, partial [Pseudomonadota bacterium]